MSRLDDMRGLFVKGAKIYIPLHTVREELVSPKRYLSIYQKQRKKEADEDSE